MRYLRVQWLHSDTDEPVTLYSELDEEGWEVRKVEIFRDGRIGFASTIEESGSTILREKPFPSLEAIAAEPEFRPVLISKEDFEAVWAKRRSPARSPA
jgi:hypothetical protein